MYNRAQFNQSIQQIMHNFSWIGMVLHENVIIATNTQQLYQEKKWSGFFLLFCYCTDLNNFVHQSHKHTELQTM